MQCGALTVGTDAVKVPVVRSTGSDVLTRLRILARDANTVAVYAGTTSSVTTATGVLVPEAAPNGQNMLEFRNPGDVYVIAAGASQAIDWIAD